MNIGSFNRLEYDMCAYKKRMYQSTTPLAYRFYQGAYENCNRCVVDKFWRPFDTEIVDIESELKNINRPSTTCDELKYNPNCKASGTCISTYDKKVPKIIAPELCSIVFNNIKKVTDPGYVLPPVDFCTRIEKTQLNSN